MVDKNNYYKHNHLHESQISPSIALDNMFFSNMFQSIHKAASLGITQALFSRLQTWFYFTSSFEAPERILFILTAFNRLESFQTCWKCFPSFFFFNGFTDHNARHDVIVFNQTHTTEIEIVSKQDSFSIYCCTVFVGGKP